MTSNEASLGKRGGMNCCSQSIGPTLSSYDKDGEPTTILGMGADGPVLGGIQSDGTPRNHRSLIRM